MKSYWPSWLDYVLLFCIAMAFFAISRCGFFMGDDLSMGYGNFISFRDVLSHTKWFYLNQGGRFFSVTSQFYFCGLLKNKIWFDIVNTLFFVLLFVACGKLATTHNTRWIHCSLLFTLLFWFLCPAPSETMFWIAGATTHLWANALAFVYLGLFLKYKEDNFSVLGKLGLFVFSILSASEFIPCASICGALVVYYSVHPKYIKGNAVPFVAGFAIGSVLVLFAPGNFLRASDELAPFSDRISNLLSHPVQELLKYKALWLLLLFLIWGMITDKTAVKTWMKNNDFLLLSLGWSIIAFTIVFRPANRALFFPETLSLVLLLRLIYSNQIIFKLGNKNRISKLQLVSINYLVTSLLFLAFIFDSASAISETIRQKNNNTALLKEIEVSGGNVALDRMVSSHRMAYVSSFPKWTWEPLADRFSLDSVHIYPHYCQDKFYSQNPPLKDVFVEDNYAEDDIFGKYSCLVVRIKEEEIQEAEDQVVFEINYTRPRKWYKVWLDKLRNYQYDRTEVITTDKPTICFNGFRYYVFWMKKENTKNLKSVITNLN